MVEEERIFKPFTLYSFWSVATRYEMAEFYEAEELYHHSRLLCLDGFFFVSSPMKPKAEIIISH